MRKSVLGSGAMLLFCCNAGIAGAAVIKCVDGAGKVTYQAGDCEASTRQSTIKIEPGPPAPAIRKPLATPPSAPVTRQATAQELAQARADAQGPRDTWARLGQAIDRGDIESALRELTPAARERFRPVFNAVVGKSKPFRFAQLGTPGTIRLIGRELATMKIIRQKADGKYAYEAMLIRGPDGRWLIDSM
jgi:Domain of unknown function (DUF4124)